MNALIIEESKEICELIVEILENVSNYKFVKAESKKEALELIPKYYFSLIIIDYWTANFVLEDMLDKIKECCREPKIIILTTSLNKEALENTHKIKVISKPFEIEELTEDFLKKEVDSK